MTKLYQHRIRCPHCGEEIIAENPFSQWVRRHPDLDSSNGYSAADPDVIWHKFRSERGRDFQLLMTIEVKTFGAQPSPAQRDTLSQWSQCARNRRSTPTKPARANPRQSGTGPHKTRSLVTGKMVALRNFGVHLLVFSRNDPDDSEWIEWDNQRITKAQLVQLLKFDVDPDTLRPMDWRSHHTQRRFPLFDFAADDMSELDAEIAVKEAAYRDALSFGAPPAERHARMVAAADARRRRMIAQEGESYE